MGGPNVDFGNLDTLIWTACLTAFHFCRDLGESYWMRCTLYVDLDLVKNIKPVPYKYTVYTPSRKDANIFEWFHDCPKKSGSTDRCLIVPSEYCKPKGMVLFLKNSAMMSITLLLNLFERMFYM